MGVAPGWGGARRLVNIVGKQRALQLLLSCRWETYKTKIRGKFKICRNVRKLTTKIRGKFKISRNVYFSLSFFLLKMFFIAHCKEVPYNLL